MPLSLDGSSGITGAINVQATGSILAGVTTVAAGSASAPSISPSGDSNTGIFFPSADTVAIAEGGVEVLRIDSTGSTLINTTVQTTSNGGLSIAANSNGSSSTPLGLQNRSTGNNSGVYISHRGLTNVGSEFDYNYIQMVADNTTSGTGSIRFHTANGSGPAERVRIDSSGRLLVGTSSYSDGATLVLQGNSTNSNWESVLRLLRNISNPAAGETLGAIIYGVGGNQGAQISAVSDAQWGTNDYPTRIVFSTTADGASSPTERMRIANDGSVVIGKTSVDDTTAGFAWRATQYFSAVRSGGAPGYINRLTNDGTLLEFAQDSTTEGTISVSGTTVSYNGAHLSRWSQLPSGQNRTEILRGSVLSNIDEMCEWGDENNEQLNRMKVSDVEGDKNVSGVFQAWDDDDDTYTNDFYCAMTGDFIIRIGADVTVERGDLLMSAGDGTAKPQDDDIVRSKTVAKVTSTHVTCTYDDGSYCVPCVLMAC